MLPETFDMPEFRDPDGSVWVWDSESHSYVQKPGGGLEQDRGHATGGDNDLFNTNQIEHSEQVGSPETEGYMSSVRPRPGNYGDYKAVFDTHPVEKLYDIRDGVMPTTHYYPNGNPQSNYARALERAIREKEQGELRTAAEWAPPGKVLCPQCQDATDQHVCPQCGKDLTPEWNNETDSNNEFFGVHPEFDRRNEFTSDPDRVPKRNREKTDDSFPSMSLSKTYHFARKLAFGEQVGQDDWDDFFSNGGSKTEIGKWLQDRSGQFHFDHGMNTMHEQIAQRDGIRYPDDVAVLGSVYNDGSADTQVVFPGAQFNQQNLQAQIEQAFGPVTLQPPVSQNPAQTKGVAFQPVEITGGQWVIAPSHSKQPITGVAWIKGVSQTPYNPQDILVAEHLQPEDIELWQNGVKAIITATGGLTSHAAYLASTQGIPVVVGIGAAYNKIESGNYLKVDPQRQVITVMPGADASMSPEQKHQVSDAYIQYQMSHGGSLKPQFAHVDEEIAWREAHGPTLDNCPECSDVMHDQDGSSVCHGCGHKQPIIMHEGAVLAPLGEAAIGGLAGGAEAGGAAGAAGGAGLMGGPGGGISGIGSLMQKALGGNPLQNAYYGDKLMGGGQQGGGEQGQPGAQTMADPSAMQGVISAWKEAHTAGAIGDILEGIWHALQKAPEAFVDPKNPLSYADDAAAAAAGAGTSNQAVSKVGFFEALGSDTFGEDEVGTATKNRGENSDPDQQSSSGDSSKEHGDSPEQLKDVDGEGGPTDSAPADDLKNQGDPALQEKALKSLHMNMPLVLEFSESDDPGSDNPILVALDQLLEEAFPGYKDGHDPLGETTEHPQDEKSEDESGEKPDDGDSSNGDEKSNPKEASVWHFANPYGEPPTRDPIEGPEQPEYACIGCGNELRPSELVQGACPHCGEVEFDDINDARHADDHLRDLDAEQAPDHYDMYGPDKPTWSDMFPHEGALKEAFGEGLAAPGAPAAVPGQMPAAMPAAAPTCPMCGQTHAPGTACPQGAAGAAVTAPAAVGAPISPAQPNTVVTKWQVVSLDPGHVEDMAAMQRAEGFEEPTRGPEDWYRYDCGHARGPGDPEHCQECYPETNNVVPLDPMQQGMYGPNAGHSTHAAVDDEFAFYAASDEKHEEHETEHKHEDSDDSHDSSDDDAPFVDESGTPLQEGAEYEMKASSYAIPDRVTIDRVLPEKLVYTIHTGDVDYQDQVSKQQLDVDGVSFSPVGTGEAPYDSMDGFQDYEAPVRPGQDATPQVDDISSPSTVVSSAQEFAPISLDSYTGSFQGDAPDNRSWLMGGESSEIAVDPGLMAKFAAKDFSPREQREFIDERGEARNLDRLQLEGTHYVVDDIDAQFNW